ncbi:hypothetical protein G9A89_006295 [Geosiphon pyriformis]|nr:hypothetical protein G9A89_006295 [Geosiphon pyriformis]
MTINISSQFLDVCSSGNFSGLRQSLLATDLDIVNVYIDESLRNLVRKHSSVLSNDCADKLASMAVSLNLVLPVLVKDKFIRAGETIVFGNVCHFTKKVFEYVYHASWAVGSGSGVIDNCLVGDMDWIHMVSVWHPDSHMLADFTRSHKDILQKKFDTIFDSLVEA